MSVSFLASGNTTFAVYVLSFGMAALLTFVSAVRASRIEDSDTRRGLVWLLLSTGGWATAHVGYLVVPTAEFKLLFYYLGLIVGIATVGPWLYFCSAYTGRTLHRSTAAQVGIGGLLLGIVLIKITNPFHHRYFVSEVATTPFSHLAIEHGMIHWLAMGIAYALAVVGYFMLLELFLQVGKDTRPLAALLGVTGLPVALDVLGTLSPRLLNMTYAPLGVAVFAIGVLFVYLEDFRTVQLAGEHEDPIIVVDEDDEVRDFNSEAEMLFPAIESGAVVDLVVPELADRLDGDGAVVEVSRAGGMRHYQISENPFSAGRTELGTAIIFTDVTEREQYRQELERQNERLENFASMVSHDLRNPLNVASLRLGAAREQYDSEDLDAAKDALERMGTLIENLLALARHGQPIEEPEQVRLSAVANRAWELVDTKEASLAVESDCTFMADESRLQQLFENLFRNAIEHGSETVSITVGEFPEGSGFYVSDDGPGIPEDERDAVFEFGHSSEKEGTGFGLAIVREIVHAHDWRIAITESNDGGTRFEIGDIEYATD